GVPPPGVDGLSEPFATDLFFGLSSLPLKTPVASRMPPVMSRTAPTPARAITFVLVLMGFVFSARELLARESRRDGSRSSSRCRDFPAAAGAPGFLMAAAFFAGA